MANIPQAAFPVCTVKAVENCKSVLKYQEVLSDGEPSAMMTPSREGGEKPGLFYMRYDHMENMAGERPVLGRLWFEPLTT